MTITDRHVALARQTESCSNSQMRLLDANWQFSQQTSFRLLHHHRQANSAVQGITNNPLKSKDRLINTAWHKTTVASQKRCQIFRAECVLESLIKVTEWKKLQKIGQQFTKLQAKAQQHHLGSQWPTHTHNRLTALFLGLSGWAGARINLLLDFYGSRKDNRSRHTDHPAGRHSIQTNQRPTSIILPFLRWMLFRSQPSNFILAWDRHQICQFAYPVLWFPLPSGQH